MERGLQDLLIAHAHLSSHDLPDEPWLDLDSDLFFNPLCNTFGRIDKIVLQLNTFYHGLDYLALSLTKLIFLYQLLHEAFHLESLD